MSAHIEHLEAKLMVAVADALAPIQQAASEPRIRAVTFEWGGEELTSRLVFDSEGVPMIEANA